jgi:hypothetical protein
MPRYTLTCTWTVWGTPGAPPNHNQIQPDVRRNAAGAKTVAHGVNVHSYTRTGTGGVWEVEGAHANVLAMVADWRNPPSRKPNVDVVIQDGWVSEYSHEQR